MGKFYGIGTGPGSSDLLTVRGATVLKQLDILYTPEPKKAGKSLALTIVSPYLDASLELKQRHFPMSNNLEEKQNAWKDIAAEILADVQAGKEVGFITLGDPMIFSTYSYLLELLKDKIETETIPGISSFSNMASTLQLPLVMDEESYTVIPATAGPYLIEVALDNMSTIVLMKVAVNFSAIYTLLAERGLLNQAVLISNSSMDSEEIQLGLEAIDPNAKLSYFSTIIVYKNQQLV